MCFTVSFCTSSSKVTRLSQQAHPGLWGTGGCHVGIVVCSCHVGSVVSLPVTFPTLEAGGGGLAESLVASLTLNTLRSLGWLFSCLNLLNVWIMGS